MTKEVLDLIITNTENDVKHFEGKPFNGRVVAEYLGNLSAAVVALARIMKEVIPNDN